MPKHLDTYYSVFRVEEDGTLKLQSGHDYMTPAAAWEAAVNDQDDDRDFAVMELKVWREQEIKVITQVQRATPVGQGAKAGVDSPSAQPLRKGKGAKTNANDNE